MSFRKRTLAKPNLGLNRRKVPDQHSEDTPVPEKDGKESISPVPAPANSKAQNKLGPNGTPGTRLSKRSKITPNVKARSTTIPDNTNSQEQLNLNIEETEESLQTNTNNVFSDSQDIDSTDSSTVQNERKKDNSVAAKEGISQTSNKLQKRKRVMPKLGNLKREPKKTTSCGETTTLPAVENGVVDSTNQNNNTKTDTDRTLNMQNTTTTTENYVNSVEDFQVGKAEIISNTNDESSYSLTELKKTSSKQVHFENTLNTLEKDKISPRKEPSISLDTDPSKENQNIATKKSNLKIRESVDYSSQSEGEYSHGIASRNKKVFKPNLGARRRKRLSSFSAHSSCDEEEEKGAAKKLSKESRIKTDGNQDKDNEKENSLEDESEKPLKVKRQRKVNRICTEEKDLATLTMQELVHYRPKSFQKVELRSKKNQDNDLEEIAVLPANAEDEGDDKQQKMEPVDDVEEDDIMAPQVMLDENGEIVVNEKSLTINKTVDDSILKKSTVIFEDSLTSSNHRRRASRVKRWKIEETLRFYKALSQIGTDFTLMSQAFGKFTRNELKKKFKQEEKINCDLVDMALSNRLPLNMELFLRGKAEMKDILEAEAEAAEAKRAEENQKSTGSGEKYSGDENDSENITEMDIDKETSTGKGELTNPENNNESDVELPLVTSPKKLSPFKKGKRRKVVIEEDE